MLQLRVDHLNKHMMVSKFDKPLMIIKNYCSMSSIHGVQYFFSEFKAITRLFWVC
jgi:hypothetical protein